MNYLTLTFTSDDDGTGELFAEFAANGFSGRGSAWFDKTNLIDVSKKFEHFPIPPDNIPTIEGGFWESENTNQLYQEHLHISAYPIDSSGTIGVRIRTATALWPEDRDNAQHYVAVELKTSYEDISSFAKNLRELVAGTITELTLNEVEI
jgi:hypothetical protein